MPTTLGDGVDTIVNAPGRGAAHLQEGERGHGAHAQEREVGGGVAAHHVGAQLLAVRPARAHARRLAILVRDVVVGQEVAVGLDR